ncbi:MAG: ABC transporter permease [Phycisphaerae bacterium]|nr:ABC transporter permease [Phycisphaerae bacterium]
MTAVLAIALNDLKRLLRDKANAFFTFVFPVLLAVFFGLLFGGGGAQRPLDLVVFDESGSPAAARFVKDLDDDPILSAHTVSDRAEGESLVKRGDALACIVLPKDFAAGADSMLAGGGLQVEAIVDPSRKAESGLLVGKLNEIAFRQLGSSFSNPEQLKRMLDQSRAAIDDSKSMGAVDKLLFTGVFASVERLSTDRSRGADDPLANGGPFSARTSGGGGWSPATVTLVELASSKDGPPSTYAITFPQGIAWVLMACITAFSSSIASERARGTMLRLSVAPISRGQVLFGKALGCFISCAIGISILMAVARLIFGVHLGNPMMLVVAITAASAAGAGVMMVISGMFRTEGAAQGAGRAIVLVLAMIGGGTIPLFFMPPFMQLVSSISPFKWAIKAVEGAIWRDYTIQEMAQPIGVLLVLTLAGAIAGWITVRRGDG